MVLESQDHVNSLAIWYMSTETLYYHENSQTPRVLEAYCSKEGS